MIEDHKRLVSRVAPKHMANTIEMVTHAIERDRKGRP